MRPRAVPPAVDSLQLPVLVLNRVFQPVRITSARFAFRMLFADTARALDQDGEFHDFASWLALPAARGDDIVPIVGGCLRVPRIIHLRRYSRVWRPAVRLTRRNLMLRDGYRCQYCGRAASERPLNIDHVLPRARGGEDSWENLVIACQSCNRRKGEHTPSEAAMPLRRRASAPRWTVAAQLLAGLATPYAEWEPFLGAV